MSKVKKTMKQAETQPVTIGDLAKAETPATETVTASAADAGSPNAVLEGVQDQTNGQDQAANDGAAGSEAPQDQAADEAAVKGDQANAGTQQEAQADHAPVIAAPVVTEFNTEETVQVVKSKVVVGAVSENQAYLDDAAANGIQAQKIAIASLNNFCERFQPRVPMNPDQAVRWHKEFYQDLLYILSLDFEEFKKAWATILIYFAEHHGDNPTQKNYTPLSEYSTSRYTDQWHKEGDHKVISTYTNLIQLARRTRSKALRQAMPGTIQLDKVGPQVLTEKQVQNLKDFYNA